MKIMIKSGPNTLSDLIIIKKKKEFDIQKVF